MRSNIDFLGRPDFFRRHPVFSDCVNISTSPLVSLTTQVLCLFSPVFTRDSFLFPHPGTHLSSVSEGDSGLTLCNPVHEDPSTLPIVDSRRQNGVFIFSSRNHLFCRFLNSVTCRTLNTSLPDQFFPSTFPRLLLALWQVSFLRVDFQSKCP